MTSGCLRESLICYGMQNGPGAELIEVNLVLWCMLLLIGRF